jgi:diguanylate cyclase (GGDEF)-like protein/PAS domain S-box-containing protein
LLHQALLHQLREMGLDRERLPSLADWHAVLETVSASYHAAEQDLAQIESAVRISAGEMDRLYASEHEQLEGRLAAIVGTLPDLLFLIDDEGRYLEAITGDEQLLFLPPQDLKYRRMHDVMPEAQAERFLGVIRKAIQTAELQVVEYSLPTMLGESRDFEGRVVPTGYELGGRATVVFLARDITLQQQSVRNARLLETVINVAREGVLILDAARRVVYANKAAGEITGLSAEELLAVTGGFLSRQLDRVSCDMSAGSTCAGRHWQEEIEIRPVGSASRTIWVSVDTQCRDARQIDYYIVIMNDVTAIHQSRAQLQHVATHDALTGLPNRALFEERLEQAVSRARRQNVHGALLLIDMDDFKRINDSLGHSIGDAMLVEVAKRLQEASRVEDMVARLGGDEFTIILEDLESSGHAARVSNKVLEVFSRPMMVDGLVLESSISIGIATFPVEGEDIADLIEQADAAMYRAKQAGGNQFAYHTPELSSAMLSNIALQEALRSALLNSELQVFYQPQFGVQDGDFRGIEALLRWPLGDGVVRMPDDFIEIAEVSGLIDPLGRWVLEEVCRHAARWRKRGLEYVRIAVNVSGRQLANPGFARQVGEILEKHRIPGSDIEIEITESMEIHEGDTRHRNLDRLHAQGIRLAVDDFGTGHSSLLNLKRFPLHRLKIDRSFIRDVGVEANDEAIVGATVALGRQLGLEVVAEGVETRQQLQFLRELECDVVQGFLFAEPMTALQVTRFFARGAESRADR